MPAPTAEEFWQSLVRTRLFSADAADRLGTEWGALPPAAAGDGSASAIAAWLVRRGALSRWQAKQLTTGGTGPFFLGPYRLLERRDRFGEMLVFTARHDPTRRLVSLAILNAKRCRDPEVLKRIMARAAIARAARTPMLSRTWGLEQAEGTTFVVCEHVAGGTLADEVEQLGPLPPEQAVSVVADTARAVAELHALGGVHGGLSLDALRRELPPAGGDRRQGRVRLMQFPLVFDPHLDTLRVAVEDPESIQRLGRRAAFVAPELLIGNAVCDVRSDVYAIGAILYALLAGRGPCWAGDAGATLATAGTGGPMPLPTTVPSAIRSLVARMLARDPRQRPSTAGDAAAELTRCPGISSLPPPPPAAGLSPGHLDPDASFVEFAVVPDAAGSLRARRPRHTAWLRWIGLVVVMVLVPAAATFFTWRTGKPRPGSRPQVARATKPPMAAHPPSHQGAARDSRNDGSPALPAVSGAVPRHVVVDDPSFPWESPTTGSPPTLDYLAPGTELVVLVRFAEVTANDEGRLFLRSLGPAVESAVGRLVTLCGGDESAIGLVQAAWQVDDGDQVMASLTVRFMPGGEPLADPAAREKAWGETSSRVIHGETVFVGEKLSFWLPDAERGRVVVIAPTQPSVAGDEPPIERIIREAAPLTADETLSVKAVLPVALETLVGRLDADRHVMLLASPQTLLKTGRGILAGPLGALEEPLDAMCGDSLQAAALSLHFGESCYVELDAVASPDVSAARLAKDLTGRIDGLADQVERALETVDPDPYGRELVLRLPAMLRIVAGQLRSGAEGTVAVLNAYVPRHAAHNITLAAELALAQMPSAAGTGRPVAAPAQPGGAVGRLGTRMTLSFANDSLERSIQVLADETGVPMEIVGADLQLEGITKNQSFGLDERDKTADEILRVILAKSNPDGKLVYVVKEEGGEERVLITTRAAAERRGDTLPPAFSR